MQVVSSMTLGEPSFVQLSATSKLCETYDPDAHTLLSRQPGIRSKASPLG
jgi:hypothetical protein